ncbi:MAG: HlyC/CorC family transporter [Alphaproteobacteria bacterium]|jgi:magnesium and cobalt transporter|nr:HlyC/CorC family transporter [Alphaproteobacteria bacterium]MBT4016731.1 HlyC/CorC family transporter [Alphaproteobacteria bacterium]MBT5161913.1 HlyC/CorC family transporter [Alphaproteobacteria bacterium]MBT5917264.1 HlyC/CorC family transporter [Alphaproteobacteria bacterium]
MSDDTAGKHSPLSPEGDRPSGGVFGWLRRLFTSRNGDANLRETLEELIEDSDSDADSREPINAEERLMLMNILDLGELRVDDVMVPRADIISLGADTSLADLVDLIQTELHSRIPVFQENLDDVLGMVHIKDLLTHWDNREDFDLKAIMRQVLFVPPSMAVLDLLLQMRQTRIHMAIVVDEYGGTDGLVTIEDLVEEIVGEIEDEHDEEEGPLIVVRDDGALDADARTPIAELENRVGLDLLPDEQDEDVDTLGGLVFSLLGRVPQRGELIAHATGLEFEIIDADPRRIKRLRVRGAPLDGQNSVAGSKD